MEKAERCCETTFKNFQSDKEQFFVCAEQKRETKSMKKENERMKKFYAGQKSRAEEYRSEQEKLTRAWFKGEESRTRELRAWGAEGFNKQQEEEMARFKEEETLRETAFSKFLPSGYKPISADGMHGRSSMQEKPLLLLSLLSLSSSSSQAGRT
jgi:hypothetical protein